MNNWLSPFLCRAYGPNRQQPYESSNYPGVAPEDIDILGGRFEASGSRFLGGVDLVLYAKAMISFHLYFSQADTAQGIEGRRV